MGTAATAHAVTSADGTPIGVWQSGAGSPLVLVHGTGSSRTRWQLILPSLERHFTVYAMDRRGRGSSGDADAYSFEREVDDVAAVVEAVSEPLVLLGHSWGGMCALEAARRDGVTDVLQALILWPTRDMAFREPERPGGSRCSRTIGL